MVLAIGEIDPTTKTHRCPFLTYDLKCNIYENRPFVCREFGKESHERLKCSFQDKDGRERSRQERRLIERQHLRGQHYLTDEVMNNSEGQLIKINVSKVEK